MSPSFRQAKKKSAMLAEMMAGQMAGTMTLRRVIPQQGTGRGVGWGGRAARLEPR